MIKLVAKVNMSPYTQLFLLNLGLLVLQTFTPFIQKRYIERFIVIINCSLENKSSTLAALIYNKHFLLQENHLIILICTLLSSYFLEWLPLVILWMIYCFVYELGQIRNLWLDRSLPVKKRIKLADSLPFFFLVVLFIFLFRSIDIQFGKDCHK